MKKLVVLGFLGTVAACGVDGEPTAPKAAATPESGFSMSGDIRIGIESGSKE